MPLTSLPNFIVYLAVVYTISLVRSSDRVDTPGMTEAKSE